MSENDELADRQAKILCRLKAKTAERKARAAELKAQFRRKPWWVRFIVKVESLFIHWPDRLKRMRLRLTMLNCDVQMATIYLRQFRARLLLRIADALEGMLDRISRGS
jgi:hypothetical protein